MNNFQEIVSGIVKTHILKHNAKFDFIVISKEKSSFLVIVSHPMLSSNIEEVINTHKMPPEIAEDYVHCRVHGLAAMLLSKIYPQNP
jgi:hypothetical protein